MTHSEDTGRAFWESQHTVARLLRSFTSRACTRLTPHGSQHLRVGSARECQGVYVQTHTQGAQEVKWRPKYKFKNTLKNHFTAKDHRGENADVLQDTCKH